MNSGLFFVLVKNRELLLSILSSMGQPLMFGQSILSWVNSHFQLEFQDPKMEVRSYHIFGHFVEIFPEIRPYMW